MSANIQAISVDIKEVGKKIKSSKKRFTWFFSINGKKHTVDLFNSKLSGKKKLLVDNKVVHEEKSRMSSIGHLFEIDNNQLQIQSKGDSFELIFNKSQSFSELYTQAKTKLEFKEDDGNYDSYENDFSKGKAMQSRYQGISSSNYSQSKNNQSNNLRNVEGEEDDYQNEDDDDYEHPVENEPQIDTKKINPVVILKKKEDTYGFDNGFGKFEWRNNKTTPAQDRPQIPLSQKNDIAFDNFSNQFANPQRSQIEKEKQLQRQKLTPDTDFSQYTFSNSNSTNQSKPLPVKQNQHNSAFEAFGTPSNTGKTTGSPTKAADPFSDFFNKDIHIFNNQNSHQSPQQPKQSQQTQQQTKQPISQQQQQQPPQPPKQIQQQPVVQQNILDLLDDDEVVPMPTNSIKKNNDNIDHLMDNISLQPQVQASQPIQQTQQPIQQTQQPIQQTQQPIQQTQQPIQQTQQPNLLNLYGDSSNTKNPSPVQQIQAPAKNLSGSNYTALYQLGNQFGEGIQQTPLQTQSQAYGGYNQQQQYGVQQGYQQQQQYGGQQQFQQQQYYGQQQQYPVIGQYPQQQQQIQQMAPGFNQGNFGYGQASMQNQGFQAKGFGQIPGQTIDSSSSGKTPFDDLF